MSRVIVINNNSNTRVVVRQEGARGEDGVPGEDGDASTNTNASEDNELVLFSGTNGKVLKRSNVLLAAIALATDLAAKVDEVPGYGLSEEDFTTALKAKLDSLSAGGFRGTFDDEAMLVAAIPAGEEGDYAYVVNPVPGEEQLVYYWDVVNVVWVPGAFGSTPYTGAEILAALDAEPNVNILTDAEYDMVVNSVQTDTFNSVVATLSGATSTTLRVVITDSTTTRTLTTSDASKYIRLTNAGACDIVIPDDAAALWTLPVEITFVVVNTPPTISPDPGVTVNFSALVAGLIAGDLFTLKRIGLNEWDTYAGG